MSPIHIQFTLFSAFYTPLIVTIAGDFLKKHGLDATWSVAEPGESAIRALESGTAQVVQSAPSQGFKGAIRGEEPSIVHFAQINEMDGFFICGRNPDEQFDWNKLVGAEVVIFGSGQPNAMFQYACHKAGIDYNQINIITPGGAADIDKAFRDGTGDFVQQQGPFPQQLFLDNLGHIVSASGPLIGPCAFSSLAATRQWLDTDEAVAFTRAYSEARNFLNEASASDLASLTAEYFPKIGMEALVQCISSYQSLGCWTPHVEITRPAFDVTQDVFMHVGSLPQKVQYEQVCALPPSS